MVGSTVGQVVVTRQGTGLVVRETQFLVGIFNEWGLLNIDALPYKAEWDQDIVIE